eukprot:gene4324-3138_t
MFNEAVDHVVRFLGVQDAQVGCTSVELGDYVERDVIPFFGWGPNEMLRSAIIRLTLDQHFNDMRVVMDTGVVTAVKKREKQNVSSSKEKVKESLTKEEALDLLDGQQVRTSSRQATLHPHPPQGSDVLRLFPSIQLTERAFGIPLDTVPLVEGAAYVCKLAAEGIPIMTRKQSGDVTKSQNAAKGIGRLLRERILRVCITYDEQVNGLDRKAFPFFAFPTSCREFSAQGPISHLENTPPHVGLPLERYYFRIRQTIKFPTIVINPTIVKHVIRAAPGRRLLFQDAVIAVLKAHGCFSKWTDFRERWATALEQCGVRIVRAEIKQGHSSNIVRMALLEEDVSSVEGEASPAAAEEEEGVSPSGALSPATATDQISATSTLQETMISVAKGTFFYAPGYPRAAQFVHEAYRRPFSTVTSFPLVRCCTLKHRSSMVVPLAQLAAAGRMIKRNVLLFKEDRSLSNIFHSIEDDAATSGGDKTSLKALGSMSYGGAVVLSALEKSPHKALTLTQLSVLIDRKAVSSRILPQLLQEGRVVTDGFTNSKGRRIGIISLPQAVLTDDVKRIVAEEPAETPKVPTPVAMSEPPAPFQGETSTLTPGPSARLQSAARKVLLIRNGYTRFIVERAGRLHLELWWQWYRRWTAEEPRASFSFCLKDVLDTMSLSTYCVVVGISNLDLGLFEELNSMAGSGENSSLSGQLLWGSPMSQLPLSLRACCHGRGGAQQLLMCVHNLVARGLVRCRTAPGNDLDLSLFSTTPLSEIFIELRCAGTVYRDTYEFYNADSTPGSVAHAVLLYWEPIWRSVRRRFFHPIWRQKKVWGSMPNYWTLPRVIIFSRVCRIDLSKFSEVLFPYAGKMFVTDRDHKAVKLRYLKEGEKNTVKNRLGSYVRALIPKFEMNAENVATAMEAAVQHPHTLGVTQLINIFSRIRDLFLKRHVLFPEIASFGSNSAAYNRELRPCVLHLGYLGETAAQENLEDPNVAGQTIRRFFSPSAAMDSTPPDAAPDAPAIATSASSPEVGDLPLNDGLDEVLVDSLRCILLSDHAHYDAEIAGALLNAFPDELVERAKRFLHAHSFFRKGRASSRIPMLTLSTQPCGIAPQTTEIRFSRYCTNTVLMDNCVRMMERALSVVSGAGEIPSLFGGDAIGLPSPLDAAFSGRTGTRQNTGDITAIVQNLPVVDAKKIIQSEEAELPLPSFSFSSAAYALDGHAMKQRRTEGLESAVQHDAAREKLREMHPARALKKAGGGVPSGEIRQQKLRKDIFFFDSIPMDPPGSANYRAFVEDSIKKLRNGEELPTEYSHPLPYPSIFHHVDGVFHNYMWLLFLQTLFDVVSSAPGVRYVEIRNTMTQTGLISKRSLDAGLSFLLNKRVVRGKVDVGHKDSSSSPYASRKRSRETDEIDRCTAGIALEQRSQKFRFMTFSLLGGKLGETNFVLQNWK